MSAALSSHQLDLIRYFLHHLRTTNGLVRPFHQIYGLVSTLLRSPSVTVMAQESDEVVESSKTARLSETRSRTALLHSDALGKPNDQSSFLGSLIINADDWGRDQENTNRALECYLRGTLSSVSAMVFMEDSERAAALALREGIDAGLHLNFTSSFSAPNAPARLLDHQSKISRHLSRHRLAQVVYHPGLIRSFEYVVSAQLDEFCRVYGWWPRRLDGHHHMHLCANVLLSQLLPSGTAVRRNFSFQSGERGMHNRLYRWLSDYILSRRHQLTDFLFSLSPIEPADRLQRIFSCAQRSVVEIETHPVNPLEYRLLAEGGILRFIGDLQIARRYTIATPRVHREAAHGGE